MELQKKVESFDLQGNDCDFAITQKNKWGKKKWGHTEIHKDIWNNFG